MRWNCPAPSFRFGFSRFCRTCGLSPTVGRCGTVLCIVFHRRTTSRRSLTFFHSGTHLSTSPNLSRNPWRVLCPRSDRPSNLPHRLSFPRDRRAPLGLTFFPWSSLPSSSCRHCRCIYPFHDAGSLSSGLSIDFRLCISRWLTPLAGIMRPECPACACWLDCFPKD